MQGTEEIWKDVPDYEGLYQVSNLGRVKRLSSRGRHSSGKGTRFVCERIIKLSMTADNGYYNACLCKNGIKKSKRVNVLVARAFIPNPQRKPQVNHIDHVKTNNKVENLEWCTASENKIHTIKAGRAKNTHCDGVVDSMKAEKIRYLWGSGERQKDIAQAMNIEASIISRVVNRKHRYRFI